MSKIFKPRRGTTYTMRSTAKKSTVLAKGEFFLEVPNTGVGTGASKIIIGDGVTTFENLPVALSGTTTSEVIADTSSTVTAALNNVVSGKEMANLFGSLKKAVSLNQSTITSLNDKVPFTLAIINSVYGYKKADGTFVAFKSQADIDSAIAAAKVGTATADKVLSGYTFTNSTTSGISGTMVNQGTKTYTINPGGSQTIPAGYHNGSGKVTANANQNTGTYTPTVRAANIDMGVNNTYRYVTTTSVPNTNSGVYTPTTRAANIDMGATNSYRYVTTTSVPNSNSGTKTITSSDANWYTGDIDMGATNTYRYVNAVNVYNRGKADGTTTHTTVYTANSRGDKLDMGATHSHRYVNTTGVPNANSGVYTPTTRGEKLEMGATNTYRYVTTTSVPNNNTQTYTFTTSDPITKDLTATHNYRYVNTQVIYNRGYNDKTASIVGNALAEELVAGKTATIAGGTVITGTATNWSNVDQLAVLNNGDDRTKSSYIWVVEDRGAGNRWYVHLVPAPGWYNGWEWSHSIFIDVQEIWNDGYNQGHNAGYSQGYTAGKSDLNHVRISWVYRGDTDGVCYGIDAWIDDNHILDWDPGQNGHWLRQNSWDVWV